MEIHIPDEDARFLREQGRSVPSPVSGWGIIDSGAAKTGVVSESVEGLALVTIGTLRLNVASGDTVTRPVHRAVLRLPDLENWRAGIDNVVGMEPLDAKSPDANPVICLIGRDTLINGRFTYDGGSAEWSLTVEDH